MRNLLFVFVVAMGCVGTTEKPKPDIDSTTATIAGDSSKTTELAIADTTTKIFNGAWFDIRYPADFTAKPSLKSTTYSEEYESAFFTSPDGRVSFYIFSPQWRGEASDIKLQTGEKIISKDSTYTAEKRAKTINWTIEADDKSYRRSYQEIKMDENINWVFGFKYKDEAAYNQYKLAYLRFKNSIKQYAD